MEKKMRKTIGVIGQGFVGTAIKEGMQHALTVDTYDKYKSEIDSCSLLLYREQPIPGTYINNG